MADEKAVDDLKMIDMGQLKGKITDLRKYQEKSGIPYYTHKTKAPNGLLITRKGNVFTFSWKINDADYDNGQSLQWKVTGGDWKTVKVTKKQTSHEVTINFANWKPTTEKALTAVQFRVRGHRANYYKVNKKKVKTAAYVTAVSDWSKYVFNITKPPNPKVSVTAQTNDNVNESTFTVTGSNPQETSPININCYYESVLVANCNYTDGSKAPWKSSASGYLSGTLAAAGGSRRITENASIATGSNTRWFRVIARGVAGNSALMKNATYAKHVYAAPYAPKITKVSFSTNGGSNRTATVKWDAPTDAAHPIDSVELQYAIASPPGYHLACPATVSWETLAQIRDTSKIDGTTVDLDDIPGEDEAAYVRVVAKHDNRSTASGAKLLCIGVLATPSGLTASIDSTTYKATITAENNSDVPGAFLVITAKTVKQPSGYVCGVIPNGQTTVVVQLPSSVAGQSVTFSVQAVVGTYTFKNGSYAITKQMTSNSISAGGTVPAPPSNVTAAATNTPGTIRVEWGWSWSLATVAELSWADHSDAWESTDEPNTYTVESSHVAAWNISGLEIGVDWYVRVRLGRETNDEITFGQYSDIIGPIRLSSAPAVPSLELSSGIISNRGSVQASWVYITTDGTAQSSATVAERIVNGSSVTYTTIANVLTAQHAAFSARNRGWSTGSTHEIVVRVTSASGRVSEWSEPVPLIIADDLTVTIPSTSLKTDASGYKYLDKMPLSVTVDGAGVSGTTTVIIERAEEYHIARPDESRFDGYAGETIAIYSQVGSAAITLTNDDLIGNLDEGATYNLIATVQDSYGQSVERSMRFYVAWSEAAIMPEADVTINSDQMVAVITPIAPTGASETAVCDIYRLSIDKPVLIYQGATFGESYVDPFPTIGALGGHLFVYRTADNNTITAEGGFAWLYVGAEDGDLLETSYNIIDWDTGRAFIAYNIDLSHEWTKEFTETHYLGGSVQGDWNPAVSRTGSVSGATVTVYDIDAIQAMRRLAVYPGICHVRTKEGSSFAADVQVAEDQGQNSAHKIVNFDLSVTRVDTEGLDGMTLDEWNDIQQREEEEP